MRRAYSVFDVKRVESTTEDYVVEGVASTPTTDRMGDIVEPMGAKFKLPLPALWQHSHDKPIGLVESAKPNRKGIPVKVRIPKVAESGALRDRIEEAVQSIKHRLVAGFSIGFSAVEDGVERLQNGGLRFKEWDWLELSFVTIPANAEATITSVKSLDRQLRAASGQRDGVVFLEDKHRRVSRKGVFYLD